MTVNPVVLNQVGQFFSGRLGGEIPDAETDLINEGILDSLTFVELLVYVEELTGRRVAVENLEIDQLRSVEKIGEFISALG